MIPIVEEEPKVLSQPFPLDQPRNKCTVGQVVLLEQRFKATHDVEDFKSGSTNILQIYIPPRKDDAPHVVIRNNSKYPLVKTTIVKGVHAMMDIMYNLKKFSFYDHELRKLPKLHM